MVSFVPTFLRTQSINIKNNINPAHLVYPSQRINNNIPIFKTNFNETFF